MLCTRTRKTKSICLCRLMTLIHNWNLCSWKKNKLLKKKGTNIIENVWESWWNWKVTHKSHMRKPICSAQVPTWILKTAKEAQKQKCWLEFCFTVRVLLTHYPSCKCHLKTAVERHNLFPESLFCTQNHWIMQVGGGIRMSQLWSPPSSRTKREHKWGGTDLWPKGVWKSPKMEILEPLWSTCSTT